MKKFDTFRQKRSSVYQHLFESRVLCAAGIIMMPAFLFNPSTEARIIQFLLFWLFAWLAGKKNNPIITLIIMAGIIIFNLLVPYGEELFRIGRFRITEGALWGGIHRAVTLEGLIMLSRVSIRRDLKLPGTFGALIGESFQMLEKINERKSLISRKNIIGGIDQLMIELSADDEMLPAEEKTPVRKPFVPGAVILVLACSLIWFVTIFFCKL
jgi:heptaprenyl diphosphate synthase